MQRRSAKLIRVSQDGILSLYRALMDFCRSLYAQSEFTRTKFVNSTFGRSKFAFVLLCVGLIFPAVGNSAGDQSCESYFTPRANIESDSFRTGLVLLANVPRYSESYQAIQQIHEKIIENLSSNVKAVDFSTQSPWVRDWFPLIIREKNSDKLRAIYFTPNNEWGRSSARSIRNILESIGIPSQYIDLRMDWGNFVTDAQGRLFAATRYVERGDLAQNIAYREGLKLLREGLNQDLVILPALPRESTGHVDMFLHYLGDNHFILADSRDRVRKKMLDGVEVTLKQLGYKVSRILNAGSDSGRAALSYTNALIVGNRVLLPVYGKYIESRYKYQTELHAKTDRLSWKFFRAFDKIFATSFYSKSKARSAEDQAAIEREIENHQTDDLSAVEKYLELGYEVYPIYMNNVVELDGMVHCLTRCLPPEVEELFPLELFKTKVDKAAPKRFGFF